MMERVEISSQLEVMRRDNHETGKTDVKDSLGCFYRLYKLEVFSHWHWHGNFAGIISLSLHLCLPTHSMPKFSINNASA